MYSLQTSLIILGMVLTGTARSVGVKIFYQLGCDDNPLLVALLYLFGQSMSLVVYWFTKYYCCDDQNHQEQQKHHEYAPVRQQRRQDDKNDDDDDDNSSTATDDSSNATEVFSSSTPFSASELEMGQVVLLIDNNNNDNNKNNKNDDDDNFENNEQPLYSSPPNSSSSSPPIIKPSSSRGSQTGLTEESQQAVAWIHNIPWQLKPLIPGLFNLANAALKWASFVYVAASIAEMLMSGLELVLSVIVARLVRKRNINRMRWIGVVVVTIGLSIVHYVADVYNNNKDGGPDDNNENNDNDNGNNHHWIGALLIVGQCATAVAQDISEELFLQEADFPATLLLGMEGLVGLIFGIPIYYQYSPEPPSETITNLLDEENDNDHHWKLYYLMGLVVVFTVTGIFNILTTSVTSSMTRNMWKNCRTLMVWIVGLVLYYGGPTLFPGLFVSSSSVDEEEEGAGSTTNVVVVGEEWIVPDSFFILGGFLIMLSGIYVYYKNK